MKKNNTVKKSTKATQQLDDNRIRHLGRLKGLTVGLDLGDRTSRYCILNAEGEVVSEGSVPTTQIGLQWLFGKIRSSRVAMEVGTHSPWVSRAVGKMGHEVIVANSHKVHLITKSVRKNDRIDAEKLARLGRADVKLLSPIQHRGEAAQQDLAMIRARAELMGLRTALVNSVRGLVKPMGERLAECDADYVGVNLGKSLSEGTQAVVQPLLKAAEAISQQIGEYDRKIEAMAEKYPEVELLKQVYGVGILIALTFVLTIEDPKRFTHSRDVGAFFGLQPKERESGDSKPQLGISKTGDRLMRSLLVQGAHCILRRGAPDSDLRAWGTGKMKQGGKKAKKRAVVAVARKLGVLLHHLWVTGEVYDPVYNRQAKEKTKASRRAAA